MEAVSWRNAASWPSSSLELPVNSRASFWSRSISFLRLRMLAFLPT